MARESVRLLEGIGYAKLTVARKILARIESFDADGSAQGVKAEVAARGDDDVSER